ncbi:NEDD8 activating enzyme [Hyaloraphidium curvatum]|nr:NEDD8 activating enzyme [Hyaloraphidium curvatum]
MDSNGDDPGARYQHIYKYLERAGPLAHPDFEPGDERKEYLHESKILVIGAGGLGCELLKDLALSGFRDIHVIDMDTIDISNLNRQFLFRPADVGRPKAEVAADFIMKRIPGVVVTPFFGRIQDKDDDFYSQFQIIICGLDSVEARRWMNATIVNMYDPEQPETLKPMIDGGTEGFKGQSRIIFPRITSCYECSLDMHAQRNAFPICTIANTPRLPEHCIEWASVIQWPKEFPDTKLDGDDPEHITWLLNAATARAREFNIQGVTYSLTQGVVKNIIPAIASTNAIVAASCANEAFKLATSCVGYLDNYMMYVGDDGVYTYTFQHQRKPECPVCGSEPQKMAVSRNITLQDFTDLLLEYKEIQLKKPSLMAPGKALYMRAPPSLEEQTRENLHQTLGDLISDGTEVTVTDESLPATSLRLLVSFKD